MHGMAAPPDEADGSATVATTPVTTPSRESEGEVTLAREPLREWDAHVYHQVSHPQFDWGVVVLDRLPLEGHELVLDVGCGTGRLTEKLLERLPRGRVVAIDQSASMVTRARAHLHPRFAEQVRFVQADAAALPMAGCADVVFSTATFHWVLDHPRLFGSVYRALAPGGRLVAQCGGGANVERLRRRATALSRDAAFAPFLGGFQEEWEFADTATAERRLREAGFTDVETSLVPSPVRLPDAEAFTAFVATAICRSHLACLPDDERRDAFMRRLAELAAVDDVPYELDYWRLNLAARKP